MPAGSGIPRGNMREDDFEDLLKESESNFLDWKQDFPEGLIRAETAKARKEEGKAALLKDLVSLANTQGRDPAYLIYGVRDCRIRREVVGTSKSFDGASFQEWAENAFDPSPIFSYSELQSPDQKRVAIFEINKATNSPHVAKVTLGGILHKGQIWFRKDSKNTVALHFDIKKMFIPEAPVIFTDLLDRHLRKIISEYRKLGRETSAALLRKKEALLLQGYELAHYPGTRKEIRIGRDRNELILLLKPR